MSELKYEPTILTVVVKGDLAIVTPTAPLYVLTEPCLSFVGLLFLHQCYVSVGMHIIHASACIIQS